MERRNSTKLALPIGDTMTSSNEGGGIDSSRSDKGNIETYLLERTEEGANRKLKIGVFDIWALGITIVIGGQYFSWNAGLQAGFGSYAIATFLMGTAYICLCLCTAEISSALPFAGGAYGLARVCLGLYPGFMVGCAEAIEYMVYTASSALSLSQMVAQVTGSSAEMVPVYCLIFYLTALFFHVKGGLTFWRANAVMAVVSFIIVLIYCLGCLPWVDLARVAPLTVTTGADKPGWFLGGVTSFLHVLPLSAWFYVGVESLNLGNAYPAEVRNIELINGCLN
jgi:amino acid transporter